MSTFRVTPIARSIADQARASRRSPQYGHPAHAELATGYGPCRSCLNVFRAGEERRLLFTFDPFAGFSPYPYPGPIFIHEEDCPVYEQTSIFPPALRTLPLTFEGYGADRWLLALDRPADDAIESSIDRMFMDPAVRYIHVRNTEAGCFIANIQRCSEFPDRQSCTSLPA